MIHKNKIKNLTSTPFTLSDYHMFPVNLTTRFIYVIVRYNMNPTYLQII